MPGKKMRSIKRPRMYEALKRKFGSSPAGKTRAAKISNAFARRAKRKRK